MSAPVDPPRQDAVVVLEVRAHPGAKRDSVEWDPWRKVWLVSVREPPEEGAANRAILVLLARRLGVPAVRLTWLTGERSRSKRLTVQGLGEAEVHRLLAAPG